MKSLFKRFRYDISKRVINIVQHMMSHQPLMINRIVMDILFFVSLPFIGLIPNFKDTIMKNLTIAFGNDLSKKEIRIIARRTMRNIFHMPGDFVYYCVPRHHNRLKNDIMISGAHYLHDALKMGKGVIGLGAHMNGFLLLTVRLSLTEIPFVILTKKQRNRVIGDMLTYLKNLNGVDYIDVDSPGKGKEEITKALAANKLVYLIADERKKRDGMPVPFFGRDALTAVGPAVFSLKTGAPIIPIFIATKKEGIVIDILPPLSPTSKTEKDSVRELTLLSNRAIEDYIRKYPDQWTWNQQRWRM